MRVHHEYHYSIDYENQFKHQDRHQYRHHGATLEFKVEQVQEEKTNTNKVQENTTLYNNSSFSNSITVVTADTLFQQVNELINYLKEVVENAPNVDQEEVTQKVEEYLNEISNTYELANVDRNEYINFLNNEINNVLNPAINGDFAQVSDSQVREFVLNVVNKTKEALYNLPNRATQTSYVNAATSSNVTYNSQETSATVNTEVTTEKTEGLFQQVNELINYLKEVVENSPNVNQEEVTQKVEEYLNEISNTYELANVDRNEYINFLNNEINNVLNPAINGDFAQVSDPQVREFVLDLVNKTKEALYNLPNRATQTSYVNAATSSNVTYNSQETQSFNDIEVTVPPTATKDNPTTVQLNNLLVKVWYEQNSDGTYKVWFEAESTDGEPVNAQLELLAANGQKPEWVGGNPYTLQLDGQQTDIEYWTPVKDEEVPVILHIINSTPEQTTATTTEETTSSEKANATEEQVAAPATEETSAEQTTATTTKETTSSEEANVTQEQTSTHQQTNNIETVRKGSIKGEGIIAKRAVVGYNIKTIVFGEDKVEVKIPILKVTDIVDLDFGKYEGIFPNGEKIEITVPANAIHHKIAVAVEGKTQTFEIDNPGKPEKPSKKEFIDPSTGKLDKTAYKEAISEYKAQLKEYKEALKEFKAAVKEAKLEAKGELRSLKVEEKAVKKVQKYLDTILKAAKKVDKYIKKAELALDKAEAYREKAKEIRVEAEKRAEALLGSGWTMEQLEAKLQKPKKQDFIDPNTGKLDKESYKKALAEYKEAKAIYKLFKKADKLELKADKLEANVDKYEAKAKDIVKKYLDKFYKGLEKLLTTYTSKANRFESQAQQLLAKAKDLSGASYYKTVGKGLYDKELAQGYKRAAEITEAVLNAYEKMDINKNPDEAYLLKVVDIYKTNFNL